MKINVELLRDVAVKTFIEWLLFFDMVGCMFVPAILSEWFPILQVLWFIICIPLMILCMLLYVWVKCDGEPLF